VKAALDGVRAREDLRARRSADPVDFVHRYASPADRELVALVAATSAFGNVKAIRQKLEELLALVGESPSRAADDPRGLAKRVARWKHRVYRGEDVARLLAGARAVQREHGSLGAAFREALARSDAAGGSPEDAFREALACLCDLIREKGGLPGPGRSDPGARRGPSHLLPDPRAGSAGKRLLLFLRWMVRPADGIDLGLWDVPTSRLLVPVDVHIHKLARNLGFTKRKDVSWRTAVEITRALSRFDPADPIRYDFSLCHMGMVQKCPSRRDPDRCDGCGVKPVCRHWTKRSA
jgi:uncharacterized protein (TIGR02757 family)